MRILLNALQAGNRSGTGQYCAKLAQWLPAVDPPMELHLLWPDEIAPPPIEGEDRHVHVTAAPASSALRRISLDQWGGVRIARAEGVDLIHYPANIGALIGRFPSVLTVHDLSFFRNPEWFTASRAAYYRWAAARSVLRARRIIADSHATAKDLRERLGVAAERIDVVHLGVDAHFQPAPETAQTAAREALDLPDRFLLYYGTFEPRKNLPRLIEAWDRSASVHGRHLVLAGRTGWKTGPVKDARDRAAHRDWIHLPGFVASADLPVLLSAADAFVWPSLWEGFGLPPLEAMACGVPVLTSNVASLPEVVGDAALAVDPLDLDALTDGIRRIAEDETLRAALRAKGLKRAQSFTWAKTARETAAAYARALAE